MRRRAWLALVASLALGACGTFGDGDPPAASDAGTSDAAAVDGGPPVDAAPAVDGAVDASSGKLVGFVTSSSYENVATPYDADAKCRAEADGRLPGKFVAWFSAFDPPTPAPARLVTSKNVAVDGPWYRVDGKRVVADRAALSEAAKTPLENPIDQTATGAPKTGSAWTATRADGGAGQICSDADPTKGLVTATDARWTEEGDFTAGCSSSLSLYCFQVE